MSNHSLNLSITYLIGVVENNDKLITNSVNKTRFTEFTFLLCSPECIITVLKFLNTVFNGLYQLLAI